MLINFSKLTFSKNSIRFNIRVSNILGTAQARPFVRPGLVPICLQKLSIDDTSRQIWVLLHRHLRNLARAFSTCMLRLTAFAVVFNIAYASNHAPWRNAQARARPVQPTLVFIACASNKNSNESAVSLHSKHLEDADTKSTSFFSAKAQTSGDLRRLDREPFSYSVHLIDLETQLTLVFIAYASSGSADECVHMCSLARAFSTCV